eukprot:TRINITY_DN49201_c0_g1_i1.p1 TRINITY_DN49201_c0_g1~~TRINITY_DN49201_c0_g1_i1.p1  ORF type:complete len:733 (-),score=83.07 TRINITY_DN49201_c0_g1_i1:13-2211(-)
MESVLTASNLVHADDRKIPASATCPSSARLQNLRNKLIDFSSWAQEREATPFAGLSRTLYDPGIGGNESMLDTKGLIQSDQPTGANVDDCGVEERVRIRIFESPFAIIIESAMLLNVLCTMLVSPLIFLYNGRLHRVSAIPGGYGLLGTDIAMDILYALYLVLILDMSYLHPTQRSEIACRKRVRRHHMYSLVYWLKWMSTLVYPWTAVFPWFPLSLNVIKLVRAWVLYKLPDIFWRLRDKQWVRLTQPILLIMGLGHWVACVLFCYGGFLEELEQLQSDGGLETRETVFMNIVFDGHMSSYLRAYVESVYMLTGTLDNPLGEGSPRGNSFFALVLVAVFAPVGQLIVALFLAAIVQEQNLHNALDMQHRQNHAYIMRAVQVLDIPQSLQRRVFSLYHFQKMSYDHEALRALMHKKNLSNALTASLRVHLYKDSVLCSPYFKEKDANYVIEVVRVLSDEICLPGDYVARRGEIASSMYFIARGTLAVLIPDAVDPTDVQKALQVSNLNHGQFFGEVALIKDCVRTAWIRSDSYALLASLSRDRIEPIWKHFPEERQLMEEEVAEVAMRDKKRRQQKRQSISKSQRASIDSNRKSFVSAGSTTPSVRIESSREKVLQAAHAEEQETDGDTDNGAGAQVRVSVDPQELMSGDSAALPDDEADVTRTMLMEILKRQQQLEMMFEQLALKMDVPPATEPGPSQSEQDEEVEDTGTLSFIRHVPVNSQLWSPERISL